MEILDAALHQESVYNLVVGSFLTVSGLFRPCYTWSAYEPLQIRPSPALAPQSRLHAVQQTASWLQRVGALFVDWIASTLVVMFILGAKGFSDDAASGFYVLLVFVIESALFTALVGGSFGKIATRLRVVRADATRPVSVIHAFLRQVMVALVIPPLVFRPDGRGLHDMVAGTVTVHLKDIHPDLGARS